MKKHKFRSKQLTKSGSANRRKRMLSNIKKKVLWRNRAFMHVLAD